MFSQARTADTYTPIYRTGGTKRCTWRRVEAQPTKEAAQAKAAEIEKMGYKTLIHVTRILNVIGMPTGWEA